MAKKDNFLGIMANVLLDESRALKRASTLLESDACYKLANLFEDLKTLGGGPIFCGIGKSGHIGIKLAATFSSLGLRSFFLHPTEALHGDLGRIYPNDAIFFLSKSGNTEEILKLIPFLSIPKARLVGMVGVVDSPVAKACGIIFDCSVDKEVCLNNLAPMTSTTLTLAMGDAMAVLFEHLTRPSKEDFAMFHPGGILGKTLRYKVGDLMTSFDQCPTVNKTQTLREVIFEMTKQPVGGCAVINDNRILEGIIVEGDIRRSLANQGSQLDQKVFQIMTKDPVTVTKNVSALKALELMENRKSPINILPVINDGKTFEGLITLHSLLKTGFVQKH